MKALGFVLSILVSTALALGSTILLVSVMPPVVEWTLIPALVGLMVLIYGPFTLGSLLATWDFRHDDANRRLLRNWSVSIGLVEMVTVAAIVFYAVVNGAPVWLPFLVTAGCAVLTVVAVVVGPAVLRHDLATRRDRSEWVPLTRLDVRRKVFRIVATFGAFFVLGSIAALILVVSIGNPSEDVGFVLMTVLGLAFLAGGIASVVVSFPLNHALRESTDNDVKLSSKVGKAVLARKPTTLDASEMPAALRYAQVVSVLLPFQLAFFGQLYAGLMIQQITQLMTNESRFPLVLLLGFVTVSIAITPLLIIRIRRARRWVREHADRAGQTPPGQAAEASPAT